MKISSINHTIIRWGLILLLISTPYYVQIQWLLDWSVFSRLWHNLAVFIILIISTVAFLLNKRMCYASLHKLDVIFLIFLLYGLFEVFNTYYYKGTWFTGMNGFRLNHFGALYYFIARNFIKNEEDVKLIVSVMIAVICTCSILLFIEILVINIIGSFAIIPWISESPELLGARRHGYRGEGFLRPFGIFFHMQHTGVFIAIGVLTLLTFYLKKIKIKGIIFGKGMLLILLSALILSTSRTAILSFLICALWIIIRYNLLNSRLVLGTLVVISALAFLNLEGLMDFIIISEKDTYFKSFGIIPWNFEPLKFFFGNGFEPTSLEVMQTGYIEEQERYHVFPIKLEARILNVFDYTGIIGGCLFLWIHIMAYRIGIRTANKGKNTFPFGVLIGLSLSIMMVLFSTSHYLSMSHPGIQCYYFVLFGIIGASYAIYKGNRPGLMEA